jgi:hypothetical protein
MSENLLNSIIDEIESKIDSSSTDPKVENS